MLFLQKKFLLSVSLSVIGVFTISQFCELDIGTKKIKPPKQTNKSKQNLLFLGFIDWLLPHCVYIFLIKYIKWIENNICPVKYTVLISIFF